MTPTSYEPTPDEIESRIAERRAALDEKLVELEHRLSPAEQVQRLRARLDPQPYLGIAAASAIAVGTALALRGWRRIAQRGANGAEGAEGC
jgi:uncharacterized protein DUF3618